MPSKKALMLVEYVGSGGKFDKEVKKRKQKREVLMVREEDWLDVPTFLRKKIRKKMITENRQLNTILTRFLTALVIVLVFGIVDVQRDKEVAQAVSNVIETPKPTPELITEAQKTNVDVVEGKIRKGKKLKNTSGKNLEKMPTKLFCF
ncbi:MAG: hypothetical protein KatS3mg101_1008 [Patescibacteria group bacterium]|nr:MAG: hypothetical protein KatS3mg101_1008 [Patescibacteria group bacterium]